jgi:hypothetical protein
MPLRRLCIFRLNDETTERSERISTRLRLIGPLLSQVCLRRGRFLPGPEASARPAGASPFFGNGVPLAQRTYLSWVEMLPNVVFSLVPMPFITGIRISAIPAAISPYSMAVAAVSSRQKSLIFWSIAKK